MKNHIILDTNILAEDPGVISKANDEFQFLIPLDVIRQIQNSERYRQKLMPILSRAETKGLWKSVARPNLNNLDDFVAMSPLDITDFFILKSSELYYLKLRNSEPKARVYFASNDRLLRERVRQVGIEVLTMEGLRGLLASGITVDVDLAAESRDYRSEIRRARWGGVLLGIAASLVVAIIFKNIELILATWSKWVFVVSAILGGPLLYLFRSRRRISYGMLEVFVGMCAMFALYGQSYSRTEVLQFLAGLYIVVRGMDNIEKGIDGYSIESAWRRFFGGASK